MFYMLKSDGQYMDGSNVVILAYPKERWWGGRRLLIVKYY